MGKPPSYSHKLEGDRTSLLDVLDDFPLKGFEDIEASPSTGITSLPTPHVEEPRMNLTTFIEPLPLIHQDTSTLIVQFPRAPLMKDMDSFTEGTGKGSFDSIPAGSTDQYGEPFPMLTSSVLPPVDENFKFAALLQWRDNVSLFHPTTPHDDDDDECAALVSPTDSTVSSTPTPSKRPRSMASDEEVRRIRPRAQSDWQPPIPSVERKRSLPSMSIVFDEQPWPSLHSPPPD